MVSQASIDIYDILYVQTQNGTNIPLAQIGDVANNTVYTENAVIWQQCGVASLPSNPKSGNAAQCLNISAGSSDYIFAIRDTRFMNQAGGQFSPGDTMLYAAGPDGDGQARIALKGNTGGITLYTTVNNEVGGKALGLFINPSEDSITLTNSIGNGIVIDRDGVHITLADGVCGIDLFNNGQSIQVMAKGFTQVLGGSILLGQTATLATPVAVGPQPGLVSSQVFASPPGV